jgi:hypothetical protein
MNKLPQLFTILTSPEPQTQLMAMVLSMESLNQGANVRILLCGAAADIALQDAPASATTPQKPKGMCPQGLLKKIIIAGGEVAVCALYLPNKGLTIDALLADISEAKPNDVVESLFEKNIRLLSF